jgi:dethiobiotin synthetase
MDLPMTAASALFVAGSHTDIGKTHVACALIRAARAAGRSVEVLKPAVSGFDPDDWADSDPGRLLAALGRDLTLAELDAVSPWRYRAPLSPPMAARLEGRDLRLTELVDFCRGRLTASTADLSMVEGVGGLMSPIAEAATGLDLMKALALPSVLVGGSYLGAMSHTLTALETAKAHGQAVRAIVISQSREPEAPDFHQTLADVAALTGDVPVFGAPLHDTAGWPQAVLAAL